MELCSQLGWTFGSCDTGAPSIGYISSGKGTYDKICDVATGSQELVLRINAGIANVHAVVER